MKKNKWIHRHQEPSSICRFSSFLNRFSAESLGVGYFKMSCNSCRIIHPLPSPRSSIAWLLSSERDFECNFYINESFVTQFRTRMHEYISMITGSIVYCNRGANDLNSIRLEYLIMKSSHTILQATNPLADACAHGSMIIFAYLPRLAECIG